MEKGPASICLAIDLGGTKTAVSVGRSDGTLLCSRRMPTGAGDAPEQWRDRLSILIEAAIDESGLRMKDIDAVGLAVPGPMSVAGGLVLTPPNMPSWRSVPVKAWVEDMTGKPVTINNDANAAVLAEYRYGEFRGVPDLVYLTMSTGIGAGVISGGRLVQGTCDLAGEAGHMVIDPRGPRCPCGQRGCWEVYCGGRNVALRIQSELAAGGIESLVLDEAGGRIADVDFLAFARALRRNDPYALAVWAGYLERLAQGIGIMAMVFNPRAIVLGTIGIHLGDLIQPYLDEHLSRFAWPQVLDGLTVRPSRLGPAIGDLGALALALPADDALIDTDKTKIGT